VNAERRTNAGGMVSRACQSVIWRGETAPGGEKINEERFVKFRGGPGGLSRIVKQKKAELVRMEDIGLGVRRCTSRWSRLEEARVGKKGRKIA